MKTRNKAGKAPQRKRPASLLQHFQTQKFSPPECLALAREHLSSIVTSLLFHGQAPASSKVDEQLHHFLTWLQAPEHVAGLAPSNPVNLEAEIVILSRYLFRFLAQTDAFSRVRRGPTPHDPDSTAGDRQIAGTLTAHILDSFWASLGELPINDRLVFQLYLEGLFPEEISDLLGEKLSTVSEKIQTCKLLLGQNIYDEAA